MVLQSRFERLESNFGAGHILVKTPAEIASTLTEEGATSYLIRFASVCRYMIAPSNTVTAISTAPLLTRMSMPKDGHPEPMPTPASCALTKMR